MGRLVVAKFGGSSLGVDGSSLPQVIERIRQLRDECDVGPLVVVSAPKVIWEGEEKSLTDAAIALGESYASFNPLPLEPLLKPYRAMERFIAEPYRKAFGEELYSNLKKVKYALNQAMENRLFVDVNRARVLAYAGELSTTAAVDYALRSQGIDAAHPSLSNWPIVTDHNFESANFLLEESKRRIGPLKELLEQGKVVVMGGYIGVTKEGLETTFERGGSDRSAADLAILLSKDYDVILDFEKDEMVLSADPDIVKKGLEPISRLSYNEADLAGRFGMKIVDPAAIRDLLEAECELPIYIRNMRRPERFTIIDKDGDSKLGPVKLITGRKGCAILELDKAKRTSLEDHLRMVRRYHDFLELRPYQKGRKEFARFLFLDGSYLKRYESELTAFDPKAEIRYGLGAITLVGDEMGGRPGIAARVFTAIYEGGINIEDGDVQQPTSSILIIVKEAHLEEAVRAIHSKRREMNLI